MSKKAHGRQTSGAHANVAPAAPAAAAPVAHHEPAPHVAPAPAPAPVAPVVPAPAPAPAPVAPVVAPATPVAAPAPAVETHKAPAPAPVPAPVKPAEPTHKATPSTSSSTSTEVVVDIMKLPPVPKFDSEVKFRVHYNTTFGETVCVIGAPVKLGAWNPSKAFALDYTPGSVWEGTMPLAYQKEGEFEYKYVVRRGDGSVHWETGPNRIFHYTGQAGAVYCLQDHWHPGYQDPFFSSAFTGVVHRRDAAKDAESAALVASRANVRAKGLTGPRFEIRLRCPRIDANHFFCVMGSHPALGAWNEKNAIIMDASSAPIWSAQIVLTEHPAAGVIVSGEPIRFKYGIYDVSTKKVVQWEDGHDHMLPSLAEMTSKGDGYVFIRTDEHFRFPSGNWRGAGVAVPVFSLRSDNDNGVGEFMDVIPLVDWARKVGLRLVQLLPINDTVATHTWVDSYPYAAISVFALHPLLLRLQDMGKLKDAEAAAKIEAERHRLNSLPCIDYEAVMALKSKFYKLLYDQERDSFLANPEYQKWYAKHAQNWLLPYAAFSYLRDAFGTVDFSWWPKYGTWNAAKAHFEKIIAEGPANKEFDDVAVHLFIQWHAHRQMSTAANYARQHGIVLKGDLPIGVYRNSVDVWVEPGIYNINCQAGAPPDDFSANGQNWGFPTYNWDAMAKDDYSWWKKRLTSMAQYFDAYRIDHVLGFFRIWEIPANHVDGMLGQFSPCYPMSPEELAGRGLYGFNYDRFCTPYIREHMLNEYLGSDENVKIAKQQFLDSYAPNCYKFKASVNNQKAIAESIDRLLRGAQSQKDIDALKRLKDGLFGLVNEVLFLAHPTASNCYSPRIALHQTRSYRDLEGGQQEALSKIYIHYFYERQEGLWAERAWRKLPAIKNATSMLVCAEDLGMVPKCVPPTLDQLGICSLNVQRMPKDPKEKFFHPSRASYLSVVTPSSHDTSTIRGWWEEKREVTQQFWNEQMHRGGEAPMFAEPWIVEDIVAAHMHSPAMWSIVPMQDFLGMDGRLRLSNPHAERINVPANPKHYWRYRLHLSLEQLMKEAAFNNQLFTLINNSGRNTPF